MWRKTLLFGAALLLAHGWKAFGHAGENPSICQRPHGNSFNSLIAGSPSL